MKMADEEENVEVAEPLRPLEVEYEPSSGMPPEFCEYLPKDEFMKSLAWLSENRSLGKSRFVWAREAERARGGSAADKRAPHGRASRFSQQNRRLLELAC